MRRLRLAAALAVGLGSLALAVPTASATYHLMVVREVYAGSLASPTAEYVELQMWALGQNLVAGEGKVLHLYGPDGTETGHAQFPADVPGDANQSTLVLATPLAAAQFGISADAELPPSGTVDPAGGKVCWVNLDCVSWGSFSGSRTTPSPSGASVAPSGIPDGMAIRRTIEPNGPTLLEPGDDHQDSAADFFVAAPSPRPNSVAPSERSCGAPPVGNGKPPQTTITRKPARRGFDRTPTFRFLSTQADSDFQCRLDRGPFRACRSPFTAKRLLPGRHTFSVRARDAEGDLDPTPASVAFKIERRRR